MSADHRLAMAADPVGNAVLDLVLLPDVLRWSRRILETEKLQAPPEFANGETSDSPPLVVDPTALVTVHDEEPLPGLPVLQDDAFIGGDVRSKEPDFLPFEGVMVLGELFSEDIAILSLDIVIAPH